MRLRSLFGRDVRRAINATTRRRLVAYVPLVVLLIGMVFFPNSVAEWIWFLLVGGALIVNLILGNRWASKDALEKSER